MKLKTVLFSFLFPLSLIGCQAAVIDEPCAPSDGACQPLTGLLIYQESFTNLEAEYLYWADNVGTSLRRLHLATGAQDVVFSGKSFELLEIAAGYIFYTVSGDQNLYRVGLDGTGDTAIFDSGSGSMGGVAYHGESGRLFYTHQNLNTLSSINIDGTDNTTILSGFNSPNDVMIADNTGFIVDKSNDAIHRVSLDGASQTTIANSSNGVNNPVIGAADPFGPRVYWVETPPPSNVRRIDANGDNFQTIGSNATNTLTGIAVDPYGGQFYLTDATSGVIIQSDLSGNNGNVIVSSNANNGDIELTFKERD